MLIGEGEAWDVDADDDQRGARRDGRDPHDRLRSTSWAAVRSIPGGEALRRAGLAPVTLGPKEGLALINGTQPSTAVLALALDGAARLARAADIAAALSIDALRGSIHPSTRGFTGRGFPGQIAAA